MKHRNSHLLVGYWSRLRNGRVAPDQTEVDPRAIKRILSYVFVLDASDPFRPLYRLAGTSQCERHGGELKGTGFLTRWDPQSRQALAARLQASLSTGQPLCVSSLASGDDCGLFEVETILAPLTFGAAAPTRFIGISHILGDHAGLYGKAITFERMVWSQLVQDSGESLPVEPPPPPPPPAAAVRTSIRAPHLRLVVNRDKASVARRDSDPMLQRLMEALEITPLPPVRAVC